MTRIVTIDLDDPVVLEALADQQHAIWSHWMRYQFSVCLPVNLDMVPQLIPVEKAERWQRQTATPYQELTEQEKASDREQAIKVMAVLQTHAKQQKQDIIDTITGLVRQCHQIAVDHGFWETERNAGECIALMHSELSEALEEMRKGFAPEKVAEELADVLIRIFDYCGGAALDLGTAVVSKIEKNQHRPHKHGKAF